MYLHGATTYPGLSSGGDYTVQREFDRLGRLAEIDYGDADVTPRVAFAYDPAGNRTVMREYDDSQQIRTTSYQYDTARRLVGVGFDSDGDGDTDETVSYEYDLSGNRARLTLPGDLSISYRYDAKGQLVGLTDWDEQSSTFFYDKAGRHVGTQRPNGLLSEYRYNPAGHLRRIRHFVGSLSSLRAHFGFQVDGRGNRTRAYERIAEPTSVSATYDKDAPEVDYSGGTWADDGAFKKSEQFSARLGISWTGDEGLLTMGTGPDHSIFDLYIGGSLWQSVDGYAPTAGERVIPIPVDDALEIRNRASRNIRSTGYVVRFKHLDVLEVSYNERSIQYTYDALSRLREANYNNGAEILTYGFDLAGNLVNNNGASRTYNAANQMTHDGTNSLTYDANGNLTSDGVNSYVWDRANRLLSMGGVSYVYNGDGNRIQQDALKYILDLQPGLAQVIGDSDGSRYVHAPRGIHAVSDGSAWTYPLTDALGSVRGYADENSAVLSNVNYSPTGVPDVAWDGWAFTGEWRSENETQYHRARHLSPVLGGWLSLDPFEGVVDRPMSLNGYSWVEGNVPNATDASGRTCSSSNLYAGCSGLFQASRAYAGLPNGAARFLTEILTYGPDVTPYPSTSTLHPFEYIPTREPQGVIWNPSVYLPSIPGLSQGAGTRLDTQGNVSAFVPSQYGTYSESGTQIPSLGGNACGPLSLYGALSSMSVPLTDVSTFITQTTCAAGYYCPGYGYTNLSDAVQFVESSLGLNAVSGNIYQSTAGSGIIQIRRLLALGIPPIINVGQTRAEVFYNPYTDISEVGTLTSWTNAPVKHFVAITGLSTLQQWERGYRWIRVLNPFYNRQEYYRWEDFALDPLRIVSETWGMFWVEPNLTPQNYAQDIIRWGQGEDRIPVPYTP